MTESSVNSRISAESLIENSDSLNKVDTKVEILDDGIKINDIIILNTDVANYFRNRPEELREEDVKQAIRVGVFCLERASAGQNLDFVKREVNDLLNKVQNSIIKIPAETEKGLLEKLGTGDGQVLAPINRLVKEVSAAANEKIDSIKTLMQDEIDPTKATSTLGKALNELHNLLDPMRKDSIQGSLDVAINRVSAIDGSLAETVKLVVKNTLQPLEEKVDGLSKDVRGKEVEAGIIEQTTKKGTPYEEEIVRILSNWSQRHGSEAQHVGADNKPGDVLIIVGAQNDEEANIRIVVEAKTRMDPAGRKPIGDSVNKAMTTRNANFAIYLSKSPEGLANEIGEWAEGTVEKGRWIACTHEHLISAVRFLISLDKLNKIRKAMPTVDSTTIENQIERIRTTIDRIKNINTKVSQVRSSADGIKTEADAIREDVKNALHEIDEALRKADS